MFLRLIAPTAFVEQHLKNINSIYGGNFSKGGKVIL